MVKHGPSALGWLASVLIMDVTDCIMAQCGVVRLCRFLLDTPVHQSVTAQSQASQGH